MSSFAQKPEAILRRLEWTVLRRLDGRLMGDYRALFRGFGMDLAEIREYQFGDDVRFMDWNVTARLDSPHVRRFEEDREITAWFILDMSPSIWFGSEGVEKVDLLVNFTGALARLLTRRGNRVGALVYDTLATELIPARAGRMHVLFLIDRLRSRPRLDASSPTDLRSLLMKSLESIKRRSLVFVVSDFISSPGWSEPLSYLVRRNEVITVRLVDPLEYSLPDLGILTLQDAESGEQVQVDSHDPGFRSRFEAAARRREGELRDAFDRAGADVLELSTKDDIAEAILRFAQLRKRRSQLAGAQLSGARLSTAQAAPVDWSGS